MQANLPRKDSPYTRARMSTARFCFCILSWSIRPTRMLCR
jgi:hypothetical protein